jgi:phage protein U
MGEVDRIGDLPYIQNLGKSKDNIEIEGVFYLCMNDERSLQQKLLDGVIQHVLNERNISTIIEDAIFPKSTTEYKTINDVRNSNLCRTPNNLISDSGEIIRKFVIESITENQLFFDKNGSPKKVEFSLNLRSVPESKNTFIGISSSIVNTLTDLSRSFLKW